MGETSENGWHEYKLLVMDKLGTIEDNLKELTNQVTTLSNQLNNVKSSSGFWRTMAGSVPALITMLIYLVIKK